MSLKRGAGEDGDEVRQAGAKRAKTAELDSSSDSSSESGSDDSASDEDSLEGEEVRAIEQDLLTKERELSIKLRNSKAKVARTGGIDLARERLNEINDIYERSLKIQDHTKNKTIQVYDSRNLVEGGDLLDIAIRNTRFGKSGKVLSTEDFTKRLRTFMLRNSFSYADGGDDGGSLENFYEIQHSFEKFDWISLGTFLYSRGKRAITTSHLFGPLEIERRVINKRSRAVDEPVGSVVTAEAVNSNDINSNSINQTPNSVLECFKIFKRICPGDESINLFKFVINPNSFSQSIENLFFISFLFRDGKLQLFHDDEGNPMIRSLPKLPTDERERQLVMMKRLDMPSNHLIFQLEYDSWQLLIKKYNITECCIPDRS